MRFRTTFETEQPVIAADGPQAGNLIETLGYVPGSALWGALAGRCAANLRMHDGADRDLFDLAFNSGKLRFSNLYPARLVFDDYDAARATLVPARPLPRSALTCKAVPGFRSDRTSPLRGIARGHGVSDEVGRRHATCLSCGARTERANIEFYTVNAAGGAASFAATRSYRVHNEIDDSRGRTVRGKLFAVRGLERRQFFTGWIDVSEVARPDGGSWSDLLPAAAGRHALVVGKRRGSYGGGCVRIEGGPGADQTSDLWGYTLGDRLERTQDGRFNITLNSDAIVVDQWLQHRSDLEPLRAAWEAELETAIEPTEAWVATRLYAGWNGIDGRPRDEEMVIVAGSVFTYHAPQADPTKLAQVLERIERDGVGLRRSEGFGEIVINDSFHTSVGVAAGGDVR